MAVKSQQVDAVKEVVERYRAHWERLFELSNWERIWDYRAEGIHDDVPAGDDPIMDVQTHWDYRMYTVRVNCDQIYQRHFDGLACTDETAIERYVIHELLHVRLQQMRPKKYGRKWRDHVEHEEHVITFLVNAYIVSREPAVV